MEPTTTGVAPTDGAGAPAQPVEPTQQPAAQPQEPQSQSQPAQADETAAWLQSKGVDPSDPEAFQKVAQMAFHSEKQMTKATQEASQLRQSLTQPVQPTEVQEGQMQIPPQLQGFIQDYNRDKLINNFKESHKDWQQHEPAMVEKLNEAIQTPYGVFTRSQLVGEGLLSLEDVYAMAKGQAPVDTTQVANEAKQEVLQTLANTQRAGGSAAQASSPNPQAPTEDPITAAIRAARG